MRQVVFAFLALLSACSCSSNEAPHTIPSKFEKPEGAVDHRCQQYRSGSNVFVICLDSSAISASEKVDVIYYWHGMGQSPDTIFSEGLAQSLKESLEGKGLIVVGMSSGIRGFLGDDAKAVTENLIPKIESNLISGKSVRRRIVAGLSMGGHNALRLLAEQPQLFAASAILCPALWDLDIHDSKAIDSYKKRHEKILDKEFADFVFSVLRERFPSSQDWTLNNPFSFLRAGIFKSHNIFISIGREDQLGYVEGIEKFQFQQKELGGRPITVSWVDGPHCKFDPSAFRQFLIQELQR